MVPSFTGFYRVSRTFTKFYSVLLGFTYFNSVLLGFTVNRLRFRVTELIRFVVVVVVFFQWKKKKKRESSVDMVRFLSQPINVDGTEPCWVETKKKKVPKEKRKVKTNKTQKAEKKARTNRRTMAQAFHLSATRGPLLLLLLLLLLFHLSILFSISRFPGNISRIPSLIFFISFPFLFFFFF